MCVVVRLVLLGFLQEGLLDNMRSPVPGQNKVEEDQDIRKHQDIVQKMQHPSRPVQRAKCLVLIWPWFFPPALWAAGAPVPSLL